MRVLYYVMYYILYTVYCVYIYIYIHIIYCTYIMYIHSVYGEDHPQPLKLQGACHCQPSLFRVSTSTVNLIASAAALVRK